MTKNYIGITGATCLEEVKALSDLFNESEIKRDSSHLPMLGFLASIKTLRGIKTENKRYPDFKKIPALMEMASADIFKTVHYNTRELDTLYDQLDEILKELSPNNLCQGIQLNITFPAISHLKKIKDKFSDLKIIFQANNGVINSGTPSEVAKKIKAYENSIDYVLLDPSGGKGREFDINSSVELYKRIKEKNPNLLIGFAGGFSGENVYNRCLELSDKLDGMRFSIDAEGGLRNRLSEKYGDDLLNLKKAKKYIQESSKIR